MNTTLSLSPVYLPQGKWYLKLSFGDSCWLCCIDRSESLCWTGSICGSLRAGFGDVGNHHPPHSSVLCIQQQLDVIGWF
ncbi:hypothetical protein LSAT2_028487 [Lamellibrachia satsuma]|nr:hypothetical protein LSAT2_028487 [Lamellibrachia satsuma]